MTDKEALARGLALVPDIEDLLKARTIGEYPCFSERDLEILRDALEAAERLEQDLAEAQGKALEEAAKKCDEHAILLRKASERFFAQKEFAMGEAGKIRAETAEIMAISIRALNTHPDTMNDTTKNPIAAPASPASKGT